MPCGADIDQRIHKNQFESQIVVMPRLISAPLIYSWPVDQHLNHPRVPLEVLRSRLSFCEPCERECHEVRRGDWGAMTEPGLRFEQSHRFGGREFTGLVSTSPTWFVVSPNFQRNFRR